MDERKNPVLSLAVTALTIIGAVATVVSCLITFIVLVNPAAVRQVIVEFYNPITPTAQVIVITQPVPSDLAIATPLPKNTPAISSGSLIFFDDFNDGNANGWLPAAATWSLVEGQYICIGGIDGRSFIGEDYWTNYLVSAKVKLVSGDVNAGVLGRLKDADHYYYAQLFRGLARIYLQNGGWRELASVPY